MFGIGLGELAVIALVGILVFGQLLVEWQQQSRHSQTARRQLTQFSR